MLCCVCSRTVSEKHKHDEVAAREQRAAPIVGAAT